MESRKPFPPGWPRIRVTSAGMGFAAPAPRSDRTGIAPAQATVVIDGAKLVATVVRF